MAMILHHEQKKFTILSLYVSFFFYLSYLYGFQETAKHVVARRKLKKQKEHLEEGILKTAEATILNIEDAGSIQVDDGRPTYDITQTEIRNAVDVSTASQSVELALEFGPYRFDYGINGRDLIIGGRKGHIGVFDWMTKNLLTEKNVLETVNDVS